jgi:hypothetical protein
LVFRLPYGGPGVEEAALVLASFGSAIVVAAALDRLSIEPRRLLAAISAVAILVLSVGGLLDGRLGLPPGDDNDQLSFASTLAGPGGPGRILMVSVDSDLIPGESRPGPGFWYRTLDGQGTTIDEVWLPEVRSGDQLLDESIDLIASGAELRPGQLLSQFSIDWVVIAGPESPLDQILESQLDLIPTPLLPGSKVYENPGAAPLAAGSLVVPVPEPAGDGELIWARQGAGFGGRPGEVRMGITVNHSPGWRPDAMSEGWHLTVAATDGAAAFAGSGYLAYAPYVAAGLLLAALAFLAWGTARR